jgi:hypothetical protein
MKEDILKVSAQEIYDNFGGGSDYSYEESMEYSEELESEIDRRDAKIVGWHRTTHRLKDEIESNGLLPRQDSGMVSRDSSNEEDFNVESIPDRVYFTVENGGIYPHADDATTRFLGGRGMTVRAVLDPANLVPDEDSAKDTYMQSLLIDGTFAHQGPIAPPESADNSTSWIEEFEVNEKVGLPNHVYDHLLHDAEGELKEGTELWEKAQKIQESYDTQLSPAEASWLLEYNKERQEENKITLPTAMEPEPDQDLEELIEELEDKE